MRGKDEKGKTTCLFTSLNKEARICTREVHHLLVSDYRRWRLWPLLHEFFWKLEKMLTPMVIIWLWLLALTRRIWSSPGYEWMRYMIWAGPMVRANMECCRRRQWNTVIWKSSLCSKNHFCMKPWRMLSRNVWKISRRLCLALVWEKQSCQEPSSCRSDGKWYKVGRKPTKQRAKWCRTISKTHLNTAKESIRTSSYATDHRV